MSDSQT